MHLYALIPVVAILVSAAFAAIAVAWGPDRRATSAMCAIFACSGVWAFLDLMTFLETDPSRAQAWLEWMHLPALLLGPSTTWLLGQLLPRSDDRLEKLARGGFEIGVVLGLGAALFPGSVSSVVATSWGSWVPRFGLVAIVIMPLGMVLPLMAAFEASRIHQPQHFDRVDTTRARALTLVVFISLVAVVSTEYVMPLLEWPVPRLGAAAIVFASAVMWIRVLHVADDLAVTPEGMARSMLAELHDGIALIQLDGTILASNMRFEEMSGRRSSKLFGTSLLSRVDTSVEEICGGLEDRESLLHHEDGRSLPVALSSSIARDRNRKPIGAVVVVRDLREIHLLRRRLLTSGRLAAIGELAAGIAHEVNNPIAFIRSDLHLLSRRLEELRDRASSRSGLESVPALFERVESRVSSALEGIERVAEVVGDVRDFAHVGGAGQGGSDPLVLVEGAMRLARLQCGDDVELRVAVGDRVDWVESGQELKQVLLALILILVEAMEKGGVVEAALESEGPLLKISLTADRLIEEASVMIGRFDMLAEGTLGSSQAEFGLAIAAELIDRLGASLSLSEAGTHSISIRLNLSLAEGAL